MRTKGTIFISYRRADTEGYAGRLADSLTDYFGTDRVFRDVGGIDAGEDYEEKIDRTIDQADVVLVLIGPRFLESGQEELPRLHEPDDRLAREIASALEQDRRVIPVLLQNAKMPTAQELPPNLVRLTRRNAVGIDDESFQADVLRLARILSMDIAGSVAERRTEVLKMLVVPALVIPAIVVAICLLLQRYEVSGFSDEVVYYCTMAIAACAVAASFGLAGTLPWIAASRRAFVWAAIIVGFLGTLVTAVARGTMEDASIEQIVLNVFAFASLTMTVLLMLALLALSGFKPNDSRS